MCQVHYMFSSKGFKRSRVRMTKLVGAKGNSMFGCNGTHESLLCSRFAMTSNDDVKVFTRMRVKVTSSTRSIVKTRLSGT